jgi:uncharacterized membrane protein YphA (DoxX/SURF4 family)
LAENSFLPSHAALVRGVLLPNIAILDPLVWLAETGMAVMLMLGVAVRLAGLGGILFTLNLWVGLYHNSVEWPWNYLFLIMVHAFFAMDHAGRSLGLDALLTRAGWPALRTLPARAWRVASRAVGLRPAVPSPSAAGPAQPGAASRTTSTWLLTGLGAAAEMG